MAERAQYVNQVMNRLILAVLTVAALLLMRATTRVVFYDVLDAAFAVSWPRNLANVSLLVGQAVALIVCLGPAVETAPAEASNPSLGPTTGPSPARPERRRRPRPVVPAFCSSRLQSNYASASGVR